MEKHYYEISRFLQINQTDTSSNTSQSTNNTTNATADSSIDSSSADDSSCSDGCSQAPWWIWLVLAAAFIIFIVFFSIIWYCVKVKKRKVLCFKPQEESHQATQHITTDLTVADKSQVDKTSDEINPKVKSKVKNNKGDKYKDNGKNSSINNLTNDYFKQGTTLKTDDNLKHEEFHPQKHKVEDKNKPNDIQLEDVYQLEDTQEKKQKESLKKPQQAKKRKTRQKALPKNMTQDEIEPFSLPIIEIKIPQQQINLQNSPTMSPNLFTSPIIYAQENKSPQIQPTGLKNFNLQSKFQFQQIKEEVTIKPLVQTIVQSELVLKRSELDPDKDSHLAYQIGTATVKAINNDFLKLGEEVLMPKRNLSSISMLDQINSINPNYQAGDNASKVPENFFAKMSENDLTPQNKNANLPMPMAQSFSSKFSYLLPSQEPGNPLSQVANLNGIESQKNQQQNDLNTNNEMKVFTNWLSAYQKDDQNSSNPKSIGPTFINQ